MKIKLRQAFDLQMGKTPARNRPDYWNGDHKWISIADIGNAGKFLTKTKESITAAGIDGSGIKVVPQGTVIMSFKLSIGKTAITSEDMYTNEAIMAFIDNGKFAVDTNYLYHLCCGTNWTAGTNKAVMGLTLNKATLLEKEIPLPDINEQHEIATKLDKIDALIAERQQQLELIDQAVKSRFVELFGDLKSNPMEWPVVPFTEFAKIDGNMTTDYEKYADYPHIGIDSIEKGTGALKGYRTVREDGVISGKYIFTPQHIIYSKIRPNLNKVALPDFEGLCSADAYPILPNHSNCNRVFLAIALRSEYFLEYILQFSSRTNLPKVNRKEITGFRMPLPPLRLQEQFAAFVEQTDKSKYYSVA
jgi:type I restriction enzyme S subunit